MRTAQFSEAQGMNLNPASLASGSPTANRRTILEPCLYAVTGGRYWLTSSLISCRRITSGFPAGKLVEPPVEGFDGSCHSREE